MSNRNSLAWVALVCGIAGCSIVPPPADINVPHHSVPATQPTPATPPAAQPVAFIFREAVMPKDFPPPGAVGEVIVKKYPAYRSARVEAAALPNAAQNSMFMSLFKHIQKNDIEMTSPVEMTYDPAAIKADQPQSKPQAMAFLYSDTQLGKPGEEGAVIVADQPAMTVLSVGMRGGYNPPPMEEGMKLIRQYLAANPNQFEITGPPRFLGYNSPFVPPFLQFGEVQVPVRAKGT